jgi:uncharacterized SAM-binding protein YcdF (DUF218 family)
MRTYRLTDGPFVPRPRNPAVAQLGRWLRVLVVGGVIGSALFLNHGSILEGYARLFRVDDPVPSDAIVVLLGGLESRPARAAGLYRDGLAPRVLLCRGNPPPPGFIDEPLIAVRRMAVLGVPESAITLIPAAVTSTKNEAEAILKAARADGLSRITVVTTSFHTARALWIFRKVFRGSGIDVHVAAATNPLFDEANWYRTDEGAMIYFIETVKTVYYWLKY